MDYHAQPDPSDAAFERIALWAPRNPFYTAAYAAARRARGEQPWLLELRDGEAIAAACTGFLKGRRLTIASLPTLADDSLFWPALTETCRQAGATRLVLNSFGSEAVRIPALGQSCRKRSRREYHLDLAAEAGPLAGLSSNHKRNLKRAEKAGVAVAPLVAPAESAEADCLAHARLISASMARRAERGEEVDSAVKAEGFQSYVAAGVGQLYQARLEGELLSSILVLKAARGAYYHTAGTTPEGMKCGASHLLICRVAETLATAGVTLFNLGGAGADEAGLTRFKTGFGAQPIDLEAADVRFSTGLKERVTGGLKGLFARP